MSTKKGLIKDYKKGEPVTDHIRFGLLVTIRKIGDRWLCGCDCGSLALVSENHLKYGYSRSCGCSRRRHRTPIGDVIKQALTSLGYPDSYTPDKRTEMMRIASLCRYYLKTQHRLPPVIEARLKALDQPIPEIDPNTEGVKVVGSAIGA